MRRNRSHSSRSHRSNFRMMKLWSRWRVVLFIRWCWPIRNVCYRVGMARGTHWVMRITRRSPNSRRLEPSTRRGPNPSRVPGRRGMRTSNAVYPIQGTWVRADSICGACWVRGIPWPTACQLSFRWTPRPPFFNPSSLSTSKWGSVSQCCYLAEAQSTHSGRTLRVN